MSLHIFDEKKHFENRINNDSEVLLVENVDRATLEDCINLYVADGYSVYENIERVGNSFVALRRDNDAVFINYYGAISELTVVRERESSYFNFADNKGDSILTPQITQLHLEDFGMSYAIRLSDGRYIIIDGGREFEPDAKRLYEYLKENSPHEKPVIAAWILTHAHSDHFHGFIRFMELFADEVVIEKYLFTFPEHDDTEHYPAVYADDRRCSPEIRFENNSIFANIPRMIDVMKKSGAPIYSPHTGQRYVIGDASLDILASIDDTIHLSKDVNATSLIIRMELGDQVIIWGADAKFGCTKIFEKYGDYLKADILQVPHHGFRSDSFESVIKCYTAIAPEICLLPVSDLNAYTLIDIYVESTRFLMQSPGVKEIITGDTSRTITLPYKAPDYAKAEIERKYRAGLSAGGSNVWVFSGLDTSRCDDFVFTFLNMTNTNANVWAELFFEDSNNAIRFIKIPIPRQAIKTLSIIGDEVDSESVFFNWMSLKTKEIPENSSFAVRFNSDIPVVISHKIHTPSHTSTYNNL